MKSTLTIKQEKFCHAYLETGNASEAYRLSYNTEKMKPATVSRRAKELLKHGPITAHLEVLQANIRKVSDIEKERLLYELNAILEAKITDFIEFKGGTFFLKDLSKLPEEMVRAVESIKHTRYGVELKLHGKSWTIERISKLLGYDTATKSELSFNFDTMSDNQLNDMIIKIASHE